jgi:hypothetical protein
LPQPSQDIKNILERVDRLAQLYVERGDPDFIPRIYQRYILLFRQALGTEEIISRHMGRSPSFYSGQISGADVCGELNMTTTPSYRSEAPSPAFYVEPSAIYLRSSGEAPGSEYSSFARESSLEQVISGNTSEHQQNLAHSQEISHQTGETQYDLNDASMNDVSRRLAFANNDFISHQYFLPDADYAGLDAVAAQLSVELSGAEYH